MKKITITLLLFIFVLKVFGQMSPLNPPKALKPSSLPTNLSPNLNANISSRSDNKFLWLNYGQAIQALYGTCEGSGTFLYPDTLGVVNFTSQTGDTIEPGHPFVFEIGQTFDPYSNTMQTAYTYNLPSTVGYTVDSLGLTFAYSRMDNNVTDTLDVYYFESVLNSQDIPIYYFGPSWAVNWGQDTVFVPFLHYNWANNALASSTAKITELKIPLTESDTSVVLFHTKTFALATPMTVPAGNIVACAMKFSPGYSPRYDTTNVDSFYNILTFSSYDENPGGFPYYTPGDNNNVSGIIVDSVRYNLFTAKEYYGYDSLFIASYAYGSGYTLDDHQMYYHIGFDSTLGINRISNVVASQSIYPNPANDQAILSYTVNSAASVVVNVFDITGSLIRTYNQGNVATGLNYQIINTQDLADGVYLVAIEANGIKSVSKLVVSR